MTDDQIIRELCPILGQMLEDEIVSMGRLEEVRTAFLKVVREKEELEKKVFDPSYFDVNKYPDDEGGSDG
jgi:hypothetical protein